EVFDEEQAKELEKKMKKAEFSFNDFLKMKKQMSMFGSIENILGMLPIPGLKKEDKELISHQGEKEMKRIEVFIQSMTPEERDNPEIINSSRKKRIAAGCGISLHDINIFIKQFEQMRMMMKGVSDMKGKFKHGKMPNMGQMMGMMNKFK
ncbi:MAG: signal recognition particle protein, partial [bacterium]|nr:signal recognition particle protein [bacterium]